MKIVVSFTTIPSRIKYIRPVIEALLNQSRQPEEIHIQIPEYSKKESIEYEIPSFLDDYEKIKVKRHKKDFGSASKWLYPLKYLSPDENTLLIVTDDDCLHNQKCIEIFQHEISNNPNTCFCFSGGILSRNPEKISMFKVNNRSVKDSLTIIENIKVNSPVDIIQGFGMFAIKPSWFKNYDFSLFENDDIFSYSDDILISGILEDLKIKRIQVAPYKSPTVLDQAEINPIHGNGRLLRLTLNGIEFMKKELNIWNDILCVYPRKRPLYRRILSKVKNRIIRNLS